MQTSPNGSLSLAGLKKDAKLWRDDWGIPHIKAESAWDVFVALGYAHAQDRLWQMDMQRRRAGGRWSEWVGAAGVEADKLARRLGGRSAAERDYAALGSEARSMLDAYAAGVNVFIDKDRLPREYELLGERPEHWEPWHSIAVMRQIGLLMGAFWLKLFRAAALPALGEGIGKLRYDDGGLDLLCMPPGEEAERAKMSLEALKPAIEALLASQAPDLTGGGSNNWAISGSVSATGRPILMGDPHRELEVPTIYTQAHIACDEFDAVGLTVPGVPAFPHVAHNDRVAWCVTHAFMDIHDLYIERFRGEGVEVLYQDEWHATTRRRETIKIRGGADVEMEIVETSHGPVIIGDPMSGTALAIRSMQFAETDLSFDCLPKMLKSKSVRELYQAVIGWGVIDHNLVAADVEGHVGHRVRAKVPVRPRENGWLPVPGWSGEYDWRGMVPPEEMPECIDPPGGRIVTANNRVVEDGTGPYLCTDCHPPHRARRISELLDAIDKPSIEAMSSIYMDVLSKPALLFKERLAAHAGKSEATRKILARIAAWDAKMEADSEVAALYARLRVEVTRVVARASGLAEASGGAAVPLLPPAAVQTHLWWVVPALLRDDDGSLLGGLTWEDVFDKALQAMGAEDGSPAWSALHAPVLRHPLSDVFPEAAAELDMSCVPVGGDNDTVLATGFSAGEGFGTKYSALARTSFDVGNWSACSWIVFQGSSGASDTAHRQDQNASWGSGLFVPMLYDWDEIAGRSKLTILMQAAN